MSSSQVTEAAARLLIEFGDAQSAARAAGARTQTACNAVERNFWGGVRLILAAAEDTRTSAAEGTPPGPGRDH
jgi:hypothetical protein